MNNNTQDKEGAKPLLDDIDLDKMAKVCKQVSFDVENDAKEFDGQPLDGRTVARYFGYHGAAIRALADVLNEIIKVQQKYISKL